MGQGLSVGIDDLANQCLCKVYIKPWLFSEKKVSQNLEVDSSITEIYWDLTNARFGYGLELVEGFYKLGLSPSNLEIPNHKVLLSHQFCLLGRTNTNEFFIFEFEQILVVMF